MPETYSLHTFENSSLSGLSGLNIAGHGLLSLFASSSGADVICLEPEAAGSSPKMNSTFSDFKAVAPDLFESVSQEPVALENFTSSEPFDIAFVDNAIHHFNETATRKLQTDPGALGAYTKMFTTIFNFLRPGGKLIGAIAVGQTFSGT